MWKEGSTPPIALIMEVNAFLSQSKAQVKVGNSAHTSEGHRVRA